MTSISQLLSDIEQAPDGPRVAAIFDFDGTLIAGYSAVAFIREQLRRGDLQEALERLLLLPQPTEALATNGAEIAAGHLASLLK